MCIFCPGLFPDRSIFLHENEDHGSMSQAYFKRMWIFLSLFRICGETEQTEFELAESGCGSFSRFKYCLQSEAPADFTVCSCVGHELQRQLDWVLICLPLFRPSEPIRTEVTHPREPVWVVFGTRSRCEHSWALFSVSPMGTQLDV